MLQLQWEWGDGEKWLDLESILALTQEDSVYVENERWQMKTNFWDFDLSNWVDDEGSP